MIKTFLTGAVPVGLFVYLVMFHTTVFLVFFIGLGLALASYMVGEAIREEFFKDKNG
jgi:hypothetical protein